MTTSTKFRAPTADGRMMYPVSDRPADISEWVTPTEEVRSSAGLRGPVFLIVARDVERIEYTRVSSPRFGKVLEYVRVVSNEYVPATVSTADWEAFQGSLGYDDDGDPIAARMYRATRAEPTYETAHVDLSEYADFPVDLLAPESVADVDPTFSWDVAAPYLVFGAAYANAVPGTLNNIRERLAKEVDSALPGVNVWTHKSREGSVSGYVTLRYEDSRTFPVKSGRKTTLVLSSQNFPFDFPIPAFIVGASKAEAIDKFNALRDSIIDQISTAHAVVCSHCSGAGVILG